MSFLYRPNTRKINYKAIFLIITCLLTTLTLSSSSSSSSSSSTTAAQCEIDGTCQSNSNSNSNSKFELPKCEDTHDNCPFWAKRGECDVNPHYMLKYCRLSCQACFADSDSDSLKKGETYSDSNYPKLTNLDQEQDDNEEECVDLHEMCSVWARLGECLLNPPFMIAACRFSCFLCFNEHDSKRRRESKELIEKRKRLSQINYGETQFQKDKETVTQIKEMDLYIRETLSDSTYDDIRDKCTNLDQYCSYWNTLHKCDLEPAFMIQNCPLACFMCDQIVPFELCSKKITYEDGALGELTQQVLQDIDAGKWNQFQPTFLSDHNNNNDTPWLLQLQSFLSKDDARHLLHLGNSVGWYPIESNAKSKTSFSTTVLTDSFSQMTPRYESLLQQIATLTHTSISHIEHVELIQYRNKGDSYERHLDYQIHDDWKPAGPRIFSFVICLSVTTENDDDDSYNDENMDVGGAIGFPRLDWTTVKLKEGQALFWSNVKQQGNDGVMIRQEEMIYEILPLLRGEIIMAHIWVHLDDWHSAFEEGCI